MNKYGCFKGYMGLVLLMMVLVACDPSHQGELFVQNDSALEVQFMIQRDDTIPDTIRIVPGAYTRIVEFGGLGAGRDFSCCPCELYGGRIQAADSSYALLLDLNDNDNWQLDNTNQRMADNDMITCVFRITNLDVSIVD